MKYITSLMTALLVGCNTLPQLPVDPVSVTSSQEPVAALSEADDPIPVENLSAAFNAALVNLLPPSPSARDKSIFNPYRSWEVSPRADNWLKGFDFSGVGWDNVRAGTLISPRHIVMAKHYQRPKNSKIVFHPKGKEPITRTIIDVEAISITDLAIGLLDEPATSCATYPILAPGYDWQTALYGTYGIVCDQERKALLYKITRLGPQVSLRGKDQTIPDVMRELMISGDSGHPSFLPYGNNQLVFLSTHWFGGAGVTGPNPAETSQRAAIINAINVLGARNE